MVGYFHPPPEQLLRNSECCRELCNDLVLSSTWQSKSLFCDGLSRQCNRTFEVLCRKGRKGMKTGTDEERTRCLHYMQGLSTFLLTFASLLPSLLAPCSGRPWSSQPCSPCLWFRYTTPKIDHWPRVNHWLHTVNHSPRVDHWPREFADRYLENTQAFELSSDVESSIPAL